MDQVILDSKTWDFQIRINFIQIKSLEKLGPGVTQIYIYTDTSGTFRVSNLRSMFLDVAD